MCPGAGPAPILGTLDELGPNRVELDVAHRRHQMRLVHRVGGEAALEQVAGPAMREVDPPRIAPVGVRQRAAKAVRARWSEYQVDMVRHQAPGETPHAPLRAGRGD